MTLTLRTLQTSPDLVPLLVDWFEVAFALNKEERQFELSWLNSSLKTVNPLPRTYVAFWDTMPVGTIRLFNGYMPHRPQYDPWLGYSVVIPEFRGKGISRSLLEQTLSYCREIGLPRVFSYRAPHRIASRVERGWEVLEETDWHGLENGSIIKLEL